MIMQRDFEIYRIEADGKYEYQLFYLGKPVRSLISLHSCRFGAVNVSPTDGSIFFSIHNNVPDREIEDPSTFIIPVKL